MRELQVKNCHGPSIATCFNSLKIGERIIRDSPIDCGCQIFTIIEKGCDYLHLAHLVGCPKKQHSVGPYNFYYIFTLTICI